MQHSSILFLSINPCLHSSLPLSPPLNNLVGSTFSSATLQVTIQGFKSYRNQTICDPFSPQHNVIGMNKLTYTMLSSESLPLWQHFSISLSPSFFFLSPSRHIAARASLGQSHERVASAPSTANRSVVFEKCCCCCCPVVQEEAQASLNGGKKKKPHIISIVI